MRNPGEIPQYYMIGSYEAIIDKETFRKGLEKLAENKKKENPLLGQAKYICATRALHELYMFEEDSSF